MNPLIQVRNPTPVFLVALALTCFIVSPTAQALLPPPPPDGGYPNGNTAEGDFALFNLTTGFGNTAVGASALFGNTTGEDNTAIGIDALFNNSTGSDNTASGAAALASNTTGHDNTATGMAALVSNTTGSQNTATGADALVFNATGHDNTATGRQALFSNTTGDNNTATGSDALFDNTIGANNTASGGRALFNNTTGSFNIGLGFNAGLNLTTGDRNIDIGNPGSAGDAGTIRIGIQGTQTRTFVAGISGSPGIGPSVVVHTNGRLGTVASSQRFKNDIKPMDKASEAILALRPVTFHYKKEVDPDGVPQFGLIAEQVDKISPDLVIRDKDGKAYSVRYEAVNAMLLNEFLKEHGKVQELEANAAHQQKQIEALTAGLQKVSAQLERANLRRKWPRTISKAADNLSKVGWSWGCVSAIDSNGQTTWIADAHRGDGKRLVVRADEKLTAFLELQSAIRAGSGLS